MTTDFILQRTFATSDPGGLQVALQNIPGPAPVVSPFSFCVVDGSEPSVEPCQLLDGLRIAYIMETKWNDMIDGRTGVVADGHTVVVDTIDYFFPHPSITSSVFGPQREVVNHRS